MVTRFNNGDKVRGSTGIESNVTHTIILYKLEDGSVWGENELSPIVSVDDDEALLLYLCHKMNVTVETIKSPTSIRTVSDKRQVISYYLRTQKKWKYERISKLINRKHCTVLYYVNNVEDMLYINDPQYKQLITLLTD